MLPLDGVIATIFLLAVGLAMDATAVSAARGLCVERIRARHVVAVAVAFGGFQALMPVIGWFVGASVSSVVAEWDHWVAFTLLVAIGGKMSWEAFTSEGPASNTESAVQCVASDQDLPALSGAAAVPLANPFGFRVMVLLGIATSIDALAAGISLPLMPAPLWPSVIAIGVVTALFSVAGLYAGRRFGQVLGRRLDAVGGIVLIGIGSKILVQHLVG